MFNKLVLAVQKWLTLRKVGGIALETSYVYFEYYASMTALWERIIIRRQDDVAIVSEVARGGFYDLDSCIEKVISAESLSEVLSWCKYRFPSATHVLSLRCAKDPLHLRFFARDVENCWECSICAIDVQYNRELRSFRAEFLKMMKINCPS